MSKLRLILFPVIMVFGVTITVTIFVLPEKILVAIGPYVLGSLPFVVILAIVVWAFGNFRKDLQKYRQLREDAEAQRNRIIAQCDRDQQLREEIIRKRSEAGK